MTDYICSCSILSAEFLRASIHDAGDTDFGILSNAKASGSILANGKDAEVSFHEYAWFLLLIYLFCSFFLHSLCYS